MTEAELHDYLKKEYPIENEGCEWKQFSNLKNMVAGQTKEDIVSYVSGISNMNGGHLILGVKDRSLEISGIESFHEITKENLPQQLKEKTKNLNVNQLKVDEFKTSDTAKIVWVIHIPKHSARRIVIAHNKGFQRLGDSLIELTTDRENYILSEPLHEDWSAGIIEGASLNDLDSEAIDLARNLFIEKNPNLREEISASDVITFLNKVGLTIKGKITRTSIILLGKKESQYLLSPAVSEIRWILKGTDGSERDSSVFSCPFLIAVDLLYSKIRNYKYQYMTGQTLTPEESLVYDPFVIREALNNCIAHQDYEMGGFINVVEFDDHIIFTNKGSFIPVTLKNVIEEDSPEEYYRNRFLVTAMRNLKMVDTIGSGIRRMFKLQIARRFPLPDYDLSNHKVQVSIVGKVLDMKFASAIANYPDLSLQDIIALDKVQKKISLEESEIRMLKARGLIEGRKPNFYIAATIAAFVNQKDQYIRNRSLDDKHFKELILQFLDKYKKATKKEIIKLITGKLSDSLSQPQKVNKVKNLLYFMSKKDNLIKVVGRGRSAYWIKNG